MDRIQFINSINHKDKQLPDLVCKYIDQYMLLYDLVDRKDKIQYVSDNGINQINFQVSSSPQAISNLTANISAATNVKRYERVIHVEETAVSNIIVNISMTLL